MNFLFDDRTWEVRYLVLEIAGWLSRRSVVIAPTALEQPVRPVRALRFNLSREEVRGSPGLDSARPVSLQQESAMRSYYHWPPDIERAHLEIASIPLPAGREFPLQMKEDQHLRSANDVWGYEVWDDERQVGQLDNYIVDEHSWHIDYLEVRAGWWLHHRTLLVPTVWVKSLSWARRRVQLQQAGLALEGVDYGKRSAS